MRTSRRRLLGLALAAGASALAAPALAAEQQNLVDEARIVAERFQANPNYAPMRVYVQNAYGVLIVPDMLKGGVLIGGQYGNGVFLGRDAQTGLWSDPAFFTVAGGSLGLQIGGEKVAAIYTFMNPRAVDRLLSAQFKIGANAGGALGPVGSGVGAGTTLNFGEDVYLFSQNEGLFGGLAIDGTVIRPRNDWNAAYYGQRLTAAQIVRQKAGGAGQPAAADLKNVLSRF
jgi:lipid-binding SYLF domain-containing protein